MVVKTLLPMYTLQSELTQKLSQTHFHQRWPLVIVRIKCTGYSSAKHI